MGTFPQLKNAPIVEALIDVRLLVDQPLNKEKLLSISSRLKKTFPYEEERVFIQNFSGKFYQMNTEKPDEKLEYLRANAFLKENSNRLVSVRSGGFTVRSLQPYGGWQEMMSTTQSVFDSFLAEVGISAVVRLAARYINKIPLPAGVIDFDDYFRFGPHVPEDVPQVVFDFSSRIGVQAEPRALKAWISQSLRNDPEHLSVILDIDAFRADEHEGAWGAIANPLEDIHMLKNKLFFGSLTEKALEAFR